MLEFVTVPEAFSRSQALRVVGLSERQVKEWERSGAIEPADTYAFSGLVALRTLARLKTTKLGAPRIAKILEDLRDRWKESDNPLTGLRFIVEGRHILVQIGDVQMDAGSGQMLLDFADAQASEMVELPEARESAKELARKRREAEHWFQKGVELEQAQAPPEQALDAYRAALSLDPALTAAMVNIGTIYFSARYLNEAEKFYRMAVETNPGYALAQFNLGNLHDERGQPAEALEHYRKAIELDPRYADAHYNTALVYQAKGEILKAIQHWRNYLELDPLGYWSDLARRELNKLYEATVVEGSKSQVSGAG